ncbi:MAG: hypothetical protein JO222_05030, partial [Frankiales bacterium]|nr:hypothetical protein [Frankiales bacterium]
MRLTLALTVAVGVLAVPGAALSAESSTLPAASSFPSDTAGWTGSAATVA